MGRFRLLLLAALVVAGFMLLSSVSHFSGSLVMYASPSEVAPGSEFNVVMYQSSAPSGTFNLNCLSGAPVGSYGNCGSSDGRCVRPCWPYDFRDYFVTEPDWFMGVHFDGMGGYPISSTEYEINATPEGTVVDILESPSWYNGSYAGFYLTPNTRVTGSFTIDTGIWGVVATGAVVGVCYNSSMGAPTISVSGDASPTLWRTHSGTWFGKSWTCKLYKFSYNYTTASVTVNVTAPSSPSEFYFTFGSMCFFDSSYCGGTNRKIRVRVDGITLSNPTAFIYETVPGSSDISSTSPCKWYTGSYSTKQYIPYTVSSSASAGTKYITGYVGSFSVYRMFINDATFYTICGVVDSSYPEFIDSASASVTVNTPPSAVYLYAYGSNSGSPSQDPADHFLKGRVYVSGGTLFDYVDLALDGTNVKRIYKSNMTCGSTYCYKDFSIDMSGKSDGAHTISAATDTGKSTSKSFSYYQVGVRNVSATQAGNDNVSVSFEYKGGHKSYAIYIDDPACVVATNNSFVPSSSHDWQTFGPQSFQIPDCARSAGTHTLYVQLCDASGLCVTDSTTVEFSFTYTYQVSLDQPVAGTKHLSTDERGSVPSTYSEPYVISYSTDDPSATLKLSVNGSTVQSWTVTGTGSKSGSVPANYLVCGDNVFSAQLSGSSGSDSSQVTMRYVCWYASVESPVGDVNVPSADNTVVNEGTFLDVLTIADETPEDVPKVVSAYWDGTPLSSVSCPSGYTDCFRVDVGGEACGSTHTIRLEVGDGVTVYASDEETVTLNCVQRYVSLVSPADGAEYDVSGSLADFNLEVYVNYAGGDTLEFKLDGSPVTLSDYNGACAYTACYILPGTELSPGEHVLEVNLLSAGSVVASDSSTFTIYLWSFLVGEDWGVTPPLLYVEEHGSHPDVCYLSVESNTYEMTFDSDQSRWEYPISDSWVGVEVNVDCLKNGRLVYHDVYTIQGSGVQPGSPISGGGVVTVSPPKSPFPIFPDRKTASHYIYSLYHFSGVDPARNIKDLYISQDRLCIVPKNSFEIVYYRYNFQSFPEDEPAAKGIIGSLSSAMIERVDEYKSGSTYCYSIPATGVYELTFDTGKYYVFVLDVAEAASGLNMAAVAVALVVLGLVAYMYLSGR